jgi:REP element-mobilizing transposase RayT
MTRARKELVSIDTTPYYHCIGRCVRRAFLCGKDKLSGKNYAHRKVWALKRLRELAGIFAVEVCAYALMSNHYHLVLRLDKETAEQWSEDEVIRRWQKLFSLPLLVARYQHQQALSPAELTVARQIIEQWRERLMDLSWYMRCFNEHLARRANAEDGCKGRFWEGRFKSQALLDDAAVLTCMSYVDLNPIRARMASTPEASDFTSIQQRIRDWKKTTHPPIPLMRLVRASQDRHVNAIGFTTTDYLELVDWAGRAIRDDKKGAIPPDVPPILARLHIAPQAYIAHVKKRTGHAIVLGHIHHIQAVAQRMHRTLIKGVSTSRALFPAPTG